MKNFALKTVCHFLSKLQENTYYTLHIHITLSLNLILISPLYVYLSSVSFQIVARVLQPQGVTVGIVNVAESMELAQSMGGYPFNLYLIYLK